MSELDIPESWAEGNLAMLGLNERGQVSKPQEVPEEYLVLVEMEDIEKDSGRIAATRKIPNEFSNKVIFTEGNILYGKLRPYLNKCGVAAFNGICSSEIFVLNPKNMVPEFVSSFLRSRLFVEYAMTKVHGARMPRLSREQFQAHPLPIPPLGEQKRIVAKIESTSQKIEVIEKSVEEAENLLSKYRESLLAKAFRGELVPQDPNDEPASKLLDRIRAERAAQTDPKKKKKDGLPPIAGDEIPFEIPSSWEWVRMGFVLDKLTDGTHHSPQNLAQGDFKYISAKHIKGWGLDVSEVTYVNKKVHEEIYARCDPRFGDVLLIKDGATTGVAAINTLTEQFSMLSSVGLLRPSKALLNKFLLFFLKSPQFQEQILGDMAGAAIKRVTLTKIENMLIPIPPHREQISIVSQLDFYSKVIGETEQKLAKLRDLKCDVSAAILSNAFSGRLVPQDPSEGTGCDLLDAINTRKLALESRTETSTPRKSKKRVKK